MATCHTMQQTPASLGTSAAAARLGVHPDTIVRWADSGKLPCWRTPGGQRRFDPADVDALLAPTAEVAP